MSDATHFVFRDDPYAQSCEATVARADERGIVLDRTVFYPTGGGQPGDSGALVHAGGTIAIVEARKGETPDSVLHVPAPGAALPPLAPQSPRPSIGSGATVTCGFTPVCICSRRCCPMP